MPPLLFGKSLSPGTFTSASAPERSEAAVKEHRETINRLQQDNSKLQQNIADLEAELTRKCNEIDLTERKIASLEDQVSHPCLSLRAAGTTAAGALVVGCSIA